MRRGDDAKCGFSSAPAAPGRLFLMLLATLERHAGRNRARRVGQWRRIHKDGLAFATLGFGTEPGFRGFSGGLLSFCRHNVSCSAAKLMTSQQLHCRPLVSNLLRLSERSLFSTSRGGGKLFVQTKRQFLQYVPTNLGRGPGARQTDSTKVNLSKSR